jgi:hypothetical protein
VLCAFRSVLQIIRARNVLASPHRPQAVPACGTMAVLASASMAGTTIARSSSVHQFLVQYENELEAMKNGIVRVSCFT